MANFFRHPDRRQRFLLPIDMTDWVPQDDIVHLIVDAVETAQCEYLIATTKDWKQRKEMRDAPPPRGRMPKGMSARERMERRLLTKRGQALYHARIEEPDKVA